MSARSTWRSLGVCALLAAAPACGDDEPVVAQRGIPGAPAGGAPKPAPTPAGGGAPGVAGSAAPGGGLDESKIPAKLRGLKPEDWEVRGDMPVLLRESRDPFLPFIADLLERKAEIEPEGEDARLDIRVKIAENVQALQLIAVITGTGVPHAMMRDSRGLGHLLAPGDVVGAEMPFRVARITRNEVLFKPLQATEGDGGPGDISKVLLTQQELEDVLP
jgi:hypothetical protein